jgi:hypothetical protein
VNRKLIRTTLAEVKEKKRDVVIQKQPQRPAMAGSSSSSDSQRTASSTTGGSSPSYAATAAQSSAAMQMRKRTPPPAETNAEIYYYKKQMDAHTPMVIMLSDGEEIEGTIEWYDRGAFKINRKSAPNLLVLKRHVKYMYKVEDRDGETDATS